MIQFLSVLICVHLWFHSLHATSSAPMSILLPRRARSWKKSARTTSERNVGCGRPRLIRRELRRRRYALRFASRWAFPIVPPRPGAVALHHLGAERVRPAEDGARLHAVTVILDLENDPFLALDPRHHPQVEA